MQAGRTVGAVDNIWTRGWYFPMELKQGISDGGCGGPVHNLLTPTPLGARHGWSLEDHQINVKLLCSVVLLLHRKKHLVQFLLPSF